MPSRNGLTLSDFRRIGIVLTWPEAVALVLEATDQVKRSDDTLVTPDLEHILLSPDGALTILPGSPIPPNPVRQAAVLLNDLLDGAPAPAELRTLVADNLRFPPACAWIEEFTTALAFYERPLRGRIIAELAQRATSHEPSAGSSVASDRSALPLQRVPPSRDDQRQVGGIARWWRRWFRS